MPIGAANSLVNLNNMQPRFDRGYTGHEHMAGFGLINMNGRLYDPYLQRFLSPDNVVQDPLNAQNYNRYSYCLNNPLMYTDPSGWQMAPIDQFWNLGKARTNQTGFNDFGDAPSGGWGGNKGGGGYGKPGAGKNGAGLNGYYYDWSTGTYRTTNGTPVTWEEVFFNAVLPYGQDCTKEYLESTKKTTDATDLYGYVLGATKITKADVDAIVGRGGRLHREYINAGKPSITISVLGDDTGGTTTRNLDGSVTIDLNWYMSPGMQLYMYLGHELSHASDWKSGRMDLWTKIYGADGRKAWTEIGAYGWMMRNCGAHEDWFYWAGREMSNYNIPRIIR